MQGRKPDTDKVSKAKGKRVSKGAESSNEKSVDAAELLADEAGVNNGPGEAPDWMTDNLARRIWDANKARNKALNYIKDTDSFAVARYAQYGADWIRYTFTLKREGVTYLVHSNHGSYRRPHPLVKLRRDVEKDMRDMEDRLGLSPLARMRILQQLAAGGGLGRDPVPPQQPGTGAPGEPDEAANVFDYFAQPAQPGRPN